jgi:hypothetical protein
MLESSAEFIWAVKADRRIGAIGGQHYAIAQGTCNQSRLGTAASFPSGTPSVHDIASRLRYVPRSPYR